MKRSYLWLLAGLMMLALGYGVMSLYRLRIGRGDVFPEYSSLRADPLGTRALHDAATLLPERQVVRWLRPAERLNAGAGDVVILAGLWSFDNEWGGLDKDAWAALDRAAINGARVVVAWRAQAAEPGDAAVERSKRGDPWAEEAKPAVKPEGAKPEAPAKPDDKKAKTKKNEVTLRHASDHERRWGFRTGRRELVSRIDAPDATRSEQAPAHWPESLARWRSDVFFYVRPADGWRVLYRRGGEPVMIERTRGAGSITLMGDSFPLSNEAVQRERATPMLTTLLGDAQRVIFVESHLGVEEESGIAVLARRYGLGGAALTSLVVAGLWIWRRASPLVPILDDDDEVRLTLAPTAGLEALLRRSVSPAKLFAACIEAWRPGASAGDRRRLDEAPINGTGGDPVATYNQATKTLSHKRLS